MKETVLMKKLNIQHLKFNIIFNFALFAPLWFNILRVKCLPGPDICCNIVSVLWKKSLTNREEKI